MITQIKLLYMMRGLPGSGKSSLTNQLIKHFLNRQYHVYVFSTDDFWYTGYGHYQFQPHKLTEAHNWNLQRFQTQIAKPHTQNTTFIVDNCNARFLHMKPYVQLAREYHFYTLFAEPQTPWKFNPHNLARFNTHHVPLHTIQHMLEQYQHQPTIQDVLDS